MHEQPLDLRAATKAVKSHRYLLALMCALGLGAGAAYAIAEAPLPAARTLVLLPPSAVTSTSGASPYTETQKLIATATPVLSPAGTAVSPPESAEQLKKDVVVSAPSQDVLQILVHASNAAKAKVLAAAVATNYIAYVTKTASGSEQLLNQLEGQSVQLTEQVLSLQKQINAIQARLGQEKPGSPGGVRDTSLLDTLRTEQDQTSLQLNNVNTQVVEAEVTANQASDATQVLQAAEVVPASNSRDVFIALLGGLVGLLAGIALALGLVRGDHRLRYRDALASAIGVPVIASMWAKPCRSVGQWRRLLEQGQGTGPVEAWNTRRTFQRLRIGREESALPLRLLVIAGDLGAAAAAARLARAGAALGMKVQFDVGQHETLAALRAACLASNGASSGTSVVQLDVDGNAGGDLGGVPVGISLEAVDLQKSEVQPSLAVTVLVVSAGFATASDLARVALAASDSSSPVVGVVIANPDADDRTTGLLTEPREALGTPSPAFEKHILSELPKRQTEMARRLSETARRQAEASRRQRL
jgi:hypothetical protein